MYRPGFISYKVVYFIWVRSLYFRVYDIFWTAILKDLIAAYLTRKIVKHPKDDDKKANMKYLIFLVSFLMEDLGQVLCQEILRKFVCYQYTDFLTLSKFLYYEQFQTDVGTFTIANAVLMVAISAMTLKFILFVEIDYEKL